MKCSIIPVFVAIVASIMASLAPAAATPITYVWHQTSASVPDFIVTASMMVDGPISAIPFIDNQVNPGPYDFGPLLSFSFTSPGGSAHLGFFTAPGMNGWPRWTIGGGAFRFTDANDNFDFFVSDGFVSANTDFGGSPCFINGTCTGTGNWVSTVPEPATLALFGSALAGLTAMRRRRKQR